MNCVGTHKKRKSHLKSDYWQLEHGIEMPSVVLTRNLKISSLELEIWQSAAQIKQ